MPPSGVQSKFETPLVRESSSPPFASMPVTRICASERPSARA